MKGKVKSILVVVVKRRDRADGLFAASLASVPLVYNPRNSNIFSSLVFGFHRYVFELENIVLEACNVSWLRVTREKINIYRNVHPKRAKNRPLVKTYPKMKSVHYNQGTCCTYIPTV